MRSRVGPGERRGCRGAARHAVATASRCKPLQPISLQAAATDLVASRTRRAARRTTALPPRLRATRGTLSTHAGYFHPPARPPRLRAIGRHRRTDDRSIGSRKTRDWPNGGRAPRPLWPVCAQCGEYARTASSDARRPSTATTCAVQRAMSQRAAVQPAMLQRADAFGLPYLSLRIGGERRR